MIGTTRQLMHQSATVALLIAAVILTPWPLASVLTSAAYDGPTLAPLSSVLGFLPLDGREPRLAETVAAVSTAVTSGTEGPVRDSLLGDFTRYHAAMTGLGGVATVALATATAAGWRWRRTIRPAPRRLRTAATLALCGLAFGTLFFAVVTAANVSTLTHPTPAITGFLHGSS